MLRLGEQTAVSRRRPTIGYRASSNRRSTTSSSSNHNHTTSRKRVAARAAVPLCWATEASRPTTARMQQLCHIISITSHSSSSIIAAITSSRRCRIITISHSSSSRVTKLRRMLACAQTATPITTSRMMGIAATAACRIIVEGTRIFRVVRGHRISRGATRGEEKTIWTAAVALCTAAAEVSGRVT